MFSYFSHSFIQYIHYDIFFSYITFILMFYSYTYSSIMHVYSCFQLYSYSIDVYFLHLIRYSRLCSIYAGHVFFMHNVLGVAQLADMIFSDI